MLRSHTARQSRAYFVTIFVVMILSAGPAGAAMFLVAGTGTSHFEILRLGFYDASTADAAGLSREVSKTIVAQLPFQPGILFESSAKAISAGLGTKVFGQITYDGPQGAGSSVLLGTAFASGRYDDIVIDGPAGTVTTSVNMTLEGVLN